MQLRASLLSLSLAVPSRGKAHRQALGTARHQLILHLKNIGAAVEQYAIRGSLYGYTNLMLPYCEQ